MSEKVCKLCGVPLTKWVDRLYGDRHHSPTACRLSLMEALQAARLEIERLREPAQHFVDVWHGKGKRYPGELTEAFHALEAALEKFKE